MPSIEVTSSSRILTGHIAAPNLSIKYCLGGVKEILFVGSNPFLPSFCPPFLLSSLSFFSLPVASLSSVSSRLNSPSLKLFLTEEGLG